MDVANVTDITTMMPSSENPASVLMPGQLSDDAKNTTTIQLPSLNESSFSSWVTQTILNSTTPAVDQSFNSSASSTTEETPDFSTYSLIPGWNFPAVANVNQLDYIVGPVLTILSFLTAAVIVLTFIRKSMRSPTTILLTGIVASDTIENFSRYANYIYIYMKYGTGAVDLVLPYCIAYYYCNILEAICNSTTQLLWACISIQRILVIRFPFKSRHFLTTGVSFATVMGSLLLAGAYRIPNLVYSAKFIPYREYLEMNGIDPSDAYYYYYYYYYEDDENGTTGYQPSDYDTVSSSEDYCMVYSKPGFSKAYLIYNTVLTFIPFIIILVSSIYIIHSMTTRSESNEIHETKGRLQKIEMMTRAVLFFLLVEIINSLITLFFQITTILATYTPYDLWDTMDAKSIANFMKARELLMATTSLVNFWIVIAACEQFRQELKKMFCSCIINKPLKQRDNNTNKSEKSDEKSNSAKNSKH